MLQTVGVGLVAFMVVAGRPDFLGQLPFVVATYGGSLASEGPARFSIAAGGVWLRSSVQPALTLIVPPSGSVAKALSSPNAEPMSAIAPGPGGAVYYEAFQSGAVVKLLPDGSSRRFKVPHLNRDPNDDGYPTDIAVTDNGSVWISEPRGVIALITPTGRIRETKLGNGAPILDVARGPAQSVWVITASALYLVGEDGNVRSFALSGGNATDLAPCDDGGTWFTYPASTQRSGSYYRFGHIDLSGNITTTLAPLAGVPATPPPTVSKIHGIRVDEQYSYGVSRCIGNIAWFWIGDRTIGSIKPNMSITSHNLDISTSVPTAGWPASARFYYYAAGVDRIIAVGVPKD